MAAALYDLTISKGADVNFTVRILDARRDPVSFTGLAAFRAEIREDTSKPLLAAFSFQTNTGWGPLDADSALADGQVKLILPRTSTILLEVGKTYRWDFWFADSLGLVDKMISGSIFVDPNITSLPIL